MSSSKLSLEIAARFKWKRRALQAEKQVKKLEKEIFRMWRGKPKVVREKR